MESIFHCHIDGVADAQTFDSAFMTETRVEEIEHGKIEVCKCIVKDGRCVETKVLKVVEKE